MTEKDISQYMDKIKDRLSIKESDYNKELNQITLFTNSVGKYSIMELLALCELCDLKFLITDNPIKKTHKQGLSIVLFK